MNIAKEKILADTLFDIASQRMYSSLNSYFIWKWINQAINIHKEGKKKAHENLNEIVNKYRYFFHQALINSYKCFVIDLSTFFDKNYEDSFRLKKLIDEVSSKLEKETTDKVQSLLKPHQNTIGIIKKLRTEIAHATILPEKITSINYNKIERLFVALQKVVNIMSSRHDNSVTRWSHVKKDVEQDMILIFSNLKRGEKQRLEDINKKWSN